MKIDVEESLNRTKSAIEPYRAHIRRSNWIMGIMFLIVIILLIAVFKFFRNDSAQDQRIQRTIDSVDRYQANDAIRGKQVDSLKVVAKGLTGRINETDNKFSQYQNRVQTITVQYEKKRNDFVTATPDEQLRTFAKYLSQIDTASFR